MKRLVICLDGTWNNASREYEKNDSRVFRPTNVLKIARATKSFGNDRLAQIVYYDAGVGGMYRSPDIRSRLLRCADNVLGGGWGTGFEINIEEAYTFLSMNYEPGDEIFVFGFSRGASQARSLCQLIAWAGGFLQKSDSYHIPRMFTRYLDQRGEGNSDGLIKEINDRRIERKDKDQITTIPAQVKFLGVWDTVLALGWRTKARKGSSDYPLAFHTSATPPTNIATIRHALAIDERRHDFQAEIWDDSPSIEQRWFPGVHSDVGGGLIDDSLGNLSLKWICDEAEAKGLAFDWDYLRFFRRNPLAKALKKSWKYMLLDTMLWIFRGYRGVRQITSKAQIIDKSVFDRLNSSKAISGEKHGRYLPKNLIRFLVTDSAYDSKLNAGLLQRVRGIRSKLR